MIGSSLYGQTVLCESCSLFHVKQYCEFSRSTLEHVTDISTNKPLGGILQPVALRFNRKWICPVNPHNCRTP